MDETRGTDQRGKVLSKRVGNIVKALIERHPTDIVAARRVGNTLTLVIVARVQGLKNALPPVELAALVPPNA